MPIIEKDLVQRLNLLSRTKTFALKETGIAGEAVVQSLERIPSDGSIYWVPGRTRLKSGLELESVFRVDTGSGGDLLAVFWSLRGEWFHHHEERALRELGLNRSDAFPFDWEYEIPLENDVFH